MLHVVACSTGRGGGGNTAWKESGGTQNTKTLNETLLTY